MPSVDPPFTEFAPAPRPRDERSDAIDHLQHATEHEKTAIARTLHDELGGFLFAAVMDVGWAEQHLTSVDDLRLRLSRIRQALGAAIDLKRSMTESLRPSLLDNFGLVPALRWHLKSHCDAAGVAFTEQYPEQELDLSLAAQTGLFRITQEALAMTLGESALKSVDVEVTCDRDALSLQIGHTHEISEPSTDERYTSVEMALIAHRIQALGGELAMQRRDTGRTLRARFRLAELNDTRVPASADQE